MVILPSAYLPSVEYITHLVSGLAVIDLGENYLKRSPRNRARIMTGGGVMELTVNLRRANRPRTPITAMEIDYSKRWQHQHRIAIISAYRAAPFFDHYWPEIEPLFEQEFATLHQLNDSFLRLILRLLGCRTELIQYSHKYITATDDDIDMRPKQHEAHFTAKPYTQVFYDRYPFEPNLSILDLLFNEGPSCLGEFLLNETVARR